MKRAALAFLVSLAIILALLPGAAGAWGRRGACCAVVTLPGSVIVVPQRSSVVVVRPAPNAVIVPPQRPVVVVAPPTPSVVVIKSAHRPVWVPGFWWWTGAGWVWAPGHWARS